MIQTLGLFSKTGVSASEIIVGINNHLKNKHKTPIGLYKLFSQILRLRPTHIADLHQVIRTKLLMAYFKRYFWIKQAKIDKGRASKKKLTKKKQ